MHPNPKGMDQNSPNERAHEPICTQPPAPRLLPKTIFLYKELFRLQIDSTKSIFLYKELFRKLIFAGRPLNGPHVKISLFLQVDLLRGRIRKSIFACGPLKGPPTSLFPLLSSLSSISKFLSHSLSPHLSFHSLISSPLSSALCDRVAGPRLRSSQPRAVMLGEVFPLSTDRQRQRGRIESL